MAETGRDGKKWERRAARGVYWWILASPIFTGPCFACNAFDLVFSYHTPTVKELVLAVFMPFILHVLAFMVLAVWSIGSRFVWRHVQQGVLLVLLWAVLVFAFMSLLRSVGNAFGLVFFVGVTVWLTGSILGLDQAGRGDCWLMRRRGEDDMLPRPWALRPKPESPLEEGLRLLEAGERAKAVPRLAEAFREGTPGIRRRALEELEKLGEVETF